MVNHKELPSMRNDGYHSESGEISNETEASGLEGAENLTPQGAAGRSLLPFRRVRVMGNQPPWAKQHDPRFSTYVDCSSTLPGSARAPAGACRSLHDPRARPERGCCRKTAEFHGQSFTSQNQGQQCPGAHESILRHIC